MADTVRVLVANPDPAFRERVRSLSERIEVYGPEDLETRPELLGEMEVVYGGLGREQLPQARSLRWFQAGGAGVNGLLTPDLVARDVTITNARIHAEPITEHVFGMLLTVTRRLAESWNQQKARRWKSYDFLGNLGALNGKTLGVLGVGTIGAQTARVGKAFGMRVIGLRRSGRPHPDVERMYGLDERLDFFAASDVVVNILPLTERTRGVMGREAFAAMRMGTLVVNVGRGGTIDTEALMEALREGKVGAALLDVTDPEPLPEDHPLWAMENVYITPHYGGAQPGYQERAGQIFLENLRRYLAGEPMMNVVDKAEGY
jgi:phosphoglycerate dehydrogenase-like enzyme